MSRHALTALLLLVSLVFNQAGAAFLVPHHHGAAGAASLPAEQAPDTDQGHHPDGEPGGAHAHHPAPGDTPSDPGGAGCHCVPASVGCLVALHADTALWGPPGYILGRLPAPDSHPLCGRTVGVDPRPPRPV